MTTYADPGSRSPRTGPSGQRGSGRPRGAGAPPRPPRRPSAPGTKGGKGPRKRKGSPRWAKLSVILGAIVMLASAGVMVGPRLLINAATSGIDQVHVLQSAPTSIDGPINILLLGMDARDGEEADGSRADTIIIVHIPATHDQIYMVSLPRDLRVAIPPMPEVGYVGQDQNKINAAFFFGAHKAGGNATVWDRPVDLSKDGRGRGGQLTAETIDQLVPGGLKFNGMAILNYDGFLDVLTALGGVHMCVDESVYSIHYYPDGSPATTGDLDEDSGRYGQGKYYKADCPTGHDFQPWEALDYSRQRHGLDGGDYARQRHQQQLIKAIVSKMTSSGVITSPSKLLDLQHAAGDLLTLDLGNVDMTDWLFTLRNVGSGDMTVIRTNGGQLCNYGDNSDQCLLPDSKLLLQSLSNDTVRDFLATHQDWIATDQ